MIIHCRDCNEPTHNKTERCYSCKDKFNNGETMSQTQEVIDHKYRNTAISQEKAQCNECGVEDVLLFNGVCNTCLSKKDDNDVINWPKHYNAGNIQPIDAIEDWKLDFRLANAVKYIARHAHKGTAKKDLEKAIWYVQRFIDKELK